MMPCNPSLPLIDILAQTYCNLASCIEVGIVQNKHWIEPINSVMKNTFVSLFISC